MQWSPTRREFLSVAGAGGVPATGVGSAPWSNTTDAIPDHPFAPEADVQWESGVSDDSVFLQPLPSGGLVAETTTGVAILDSDGSERWQTNVSAEHSDTFVAQRTQVPRYGTAVYVEERHGITAFDARDGDVLWRFTDRGRVDGSLAVPGTFFVTDSGIAALDAIDGRERWHVALPGGVWLRPVFDGDSLYVGTTKGSFHALDADSGTERWRVDFPPTTETEYNTNYPNIEVAGASAGSVLVWNSSNGALSAFDVEDGTQRWTFYMGETDTTFVGTIRDSVAYVADTTENTVSAVEIATGMPKWTFDVPTELSWQPSMFGDSVYVAGEDRLFALDSEDGNERWQSGAGRHPVGIMADTLVVGDPKNAVSGVSLRDGTLQWRHSYSADPAWMPQIQDDSIYVGTKSGSVYALSPPDSTPLYDAYRAATGPLGLATGGLLGTAALAGAYRRRKRANAPPPEPEAFEDYERLEAVTESDHAELFDAETPAGERVALKRLPDCDPDEFTDALETWASLDFLGVLEVRRWGTDPEPWLATEWASGGSIADCAAEMADEEICRAVADVAEIIHHAHREGVVHGRLVPGNILLTEDGVRVADWRLAAEVRDAPVWLAAPETEGSGEPNQSSVAERSSLDDRSSAVEVYQLGALADHLLSQKRADDLEGVLSTALAADPDDRYDSALKFADMLRWASSNR